MDIAGDAFQLHIAHDLLDVDQASLGSDLKLGFFRDDEHEIFLKLRSGSGSVEDGCSDVNAIIGLFGFDANLVGELRTDDNDSWVLDDLTSMRPLATF